MQIVPQSYADLIAAIERQDTAQLQAWLDQFSAPDERYAALRTLAESFAYAVGPEHSIAAWATSQIEHRLTF